jgi:hypothetical protein
VRSLSESSQTSSNGSGPSGGSIAPSGGGFSPNFSPSLQETGEAIGVGAGAAGATAGAIFAYNAFAIATEGATLGFATPVVVAFFVAEGLFELFDDLFGGGGSPPTPRQLLHARHPLYRVILGVSDGLSPTEGTSAPPICGDPHPAAAPPNQKNSESKEACQHAAELNLVWCSSHFLDVAGAALGPLWEGCSEGPPRAARRRR